MSYFILADCNNFYVSCERLFNPGLEGRPVIVLSNNDGCVVARSQEAKSLNIKMGEPFFKIRDFCSYRNIAVYSSNYQLYGDISQRVMCILSDWAQEIQVYSIDEAFLTFPKEMTTEEIFNQCKEIRRRIKRWVGIPTSLGIAKTKTLAKVANDLAKKDPQGIFDLTSVMQQEPILRSFPVKDVWGVGSSSEKTLSGVNIRTAWDFREMDPSFARKKLGVVGERMVWELQGISCLPLEAAMDKKNITCSRAFGRPISDLPTIFEALSTYVNTACIKMRKQASLASAICVYLEEGLVPETGKRQSASAIAAFSRPTNHTPEIIGQAKMKLESIFKKGCRYKKCGVILLDLLPEAHVLPDLFLAPHETKKQHLMKTIDTLNAHFGKNTLFYGAMGTGPDWKMRSDRRSPLYTSSWDHLPFARA